MWQLRWNTNDSESRESIVHTAENVIRTILVKSDVSKVSSASATTLMAITMDSIDRAEPNHYEKPLVFNVPEVPTEVRGVFHKTTGVINYTALIEFVKNISSTTDELLHK